VSPSQLDAAETLCTLNFANRARATDLGIKGTKDTSANLSVRFFVRPLAAAPSGSVRAVRV
jgi:hypothetical protein